MEELITPQPVEEEILEEKQVEEEQPKEEQSKEENIVKKENFEVEPEKEESFLMIFAYIFIFALKGFKFVLYEWIFYVFNVAGSKVDQVVTAASQGFLTSSEKEELLKEEREKRRQEFYNKLPWVKSRNNYYEKEKQKLLATLNEEGSVRSEKAVVYKYTARDTDGKVVNQVFYAYSKLDVYTFLISEGYDVYRIETNKFLQKMYGETSLLGNKMSNKDLIFLLSQLSTYLKAGIPLAEAIRILSNQMGKKPTQKRIFQAITYELTNGEAFSSCLEKQGKMFPNLLVNMVKAAEATGNIEETLTDMANYYEEVEATRKEMISAIMYPAIVSVFAVGVVTFILLYVIPQFEKIYAQSSAPVTGLTKFVLDSSNFLRANALLVAGFIILIIALIVWLYKNVKAVRKSMQIFFMHLPVVKNVIIYNELTIFTKTFASLLRNNVFITTSVEILSKITTNEVYKEIMIKTVNNIIEGRKISDAFKKQWAVPEVAYYMIVTGESTGELDAMMQTVSDYYAEQHKSIVSALKSFIEPVLIAGLAVVVGTIILAVVIPMFSLMESVG